MYSVDYDEDNKIWTFLFVHATTDFYSTDILKDGIIKPDFDQVIGTVFNRYPAYSSHRLEFEKMHRTTILMPEYRKAENYEGLDVQFSTWFFNRAGLDNLNEEIERVFRHGGEVFAQTIAYLGKFLSYKGISDILEPAYSNSSKCFFVLKYDIPEYYQELQPNTVHRRLKDLMERVVNPDQNYLLKDLLEVQFLQPLPPSSIVAYGNYRKIYDLLCDNPLSPAAMERLYPNPRPFHQAHAQDDAMKDVKVQKEFISSDANSRERPRSAQCLVRIAEFFRALVGGRQP